MEHHGAVMPTVATKIQPRIVSAIVGPAGQTGAFFSAEYMSGSVRSYRGSKPNEATLTIHNLSESTIAALEKPNQTLQILAGETTPGCLFVGQITTRGVVTRNQQPNRMTTITAKDGRRVYRDLPLAVSYPPNTTVASVVQDILVKATLPPYNLALSPSNVFPTDSFPTGWAYQGRWRHALTEILAPRGYYWAIQGGVLYVLNEASVAPGNVPLITPATGLHGSPTRTKKGCNIVSTLNPAIVAGRAVQVTSKFFSGYYRAAVVDHQFDSYGLRWQTAAQLEVIK